MTEAAQAAVQRDEGRAKARAFVESRGFAGFVTALIILNAITLGLQTYPGVMAAAGPALRAFDAVVVSIFVFEIALKLFAYRLVYFRDPWRVFDFAVVAVSLVPNAGGFSVLRSLRVLRVFRLLAVTPSLRRVVEALFRALPGMGGILAILALVFYVAAVMGTMLFGGPDGADGFKTLGASSLTLFQVMTLEGWGEVLDSIDDKHPYAWAFIVAFIFMTSFAVLNLFIAVIVDSMQKGAFEHDEQRDLDAAREAAERHGELVVQISNLRAEIAALRLHAPAPRLVGEIDLSHQSDT